MSHSLQAAEGMALEARAVAEAAATQLHGAEHEVQSSRRRMHDAELSFAAKSEALEEATLQNHQLQVMQNHICCAIIIT